MSSPPAHGRAPCANGFFAGASEAAERMRSTDWSRSPLGPVATWPLPLRTALSLGLASHCPTLVLCGPDLLLFYNDASRSALGPRHPAAFGQPCFTAWPEGWAALGPVLEDVLAEGQAVTRAGLALPGPGGRRFDLSASPVWREDGTPFGAYCTLTEAGGAGPRPDGRPADEELRRRVEQLTEADRRKDEFLAMLAHELRNPLAPLRTAVQVLRLAGPAEPALRQTRDVIERQVGHMARLIDDLLDVSRITRGQVPLRTEPLDLVALVCAAVEDHRPELEAAGLRLTVALPDRPLWLRGDPTRLAQVVGNLLHNAGRFTPAGGQVIVRLGAEPGREAAVLAVADTGAGIEPDLLRRLFEPFGPAVRSRGGLGLGLALVQRLVELHGGSVQASSAGPGKGSEFTVRLPLGREPAAAARPGPRPPAERRPRRVLVIEDIGDTAESLRLLLTLCGHEVEVAATGRAGLDAARRFRPEVVLCDIGLPGGMDGYAVVRALRADPDLRRAEVIALSGYGQEEDKLRARQAGFDRHLTKPVDPQLLIDILDGQPAPADG